MIRRNVTTTNRAAKFKRSSKRLEGSSPSFEVLRRDFSGFSRGNRGMSMSVSNSVDGNL